MSSRNERERDIARSMGFGRRRRVLPLGDADDGGAALCEKLGVRAGSRLAFIGVTDPALRCTRRSSVTRVSPDAEAEPVDVLVFQADNTFALRRVASLCRRVRPGGCLWVLWPRNQRHITESHVQAAGAAGGMVGVHAVGVSGRLVGMKFVHRTRER